MNATCVDFIFSRWPPPCLQTTYCFRWDVVQKACDTIETGCGESCWKMMKRWNIERCWNFTSINSRTGVYVITQSMYSMCILYTEDMVSSSSRSSKAGRWGRIQCRYWCLFADDFVGISETPVGEYRNKKWRHHCSVPEEMESDSERQNKNAVVAVCNDDKVSPVTFKCKWGEDENRSQTSTRTLA